MEATPGPQAGPALPALLSLLDSMMCSLAEDAGAVLQPHVALCLAEARNARWLLEVFQHFGWDGARFMRPVNARSLSCRLRTFLFDGLQRKGRGAFAVVYKANDRLTGQTVTLKKLRVDEQGEEGVSGSIIREVSLLKELHHPHVVRLKDVIWDSSRLFLVMEYMDLDFSEHMASQANHLSLDKIKRYLHQLLTGLHFCHMHRILHRDLKPHNILMDLASDSLKIADFGLARCYTPPLRAYTHEVVTLLYRPPEILLGTAIYSTAVDLWSLGCIFAEMALGFPLFQGDSEIGQLFQIFQVLGTPDDVCWPGHADLPDWQSCFPAWPPKDLSQVVPRLGQEGVQLLSSMLQLDPAKRISARQALNHPFFGDFAQDTPAGAALEERILQPLRRQQEPAHASPLTLRSGRRVERSERSDHSQEDPRSVGQTHDSHPMPRPAPARALQPGPREPPGHADQPSGFPLARLSSTAAGQYNPLGSAAGLRSAAVLDRAQLPRTAHARGVSASVRPLTRMAAAAAAGAGIQLEPGAGAVAACPIHQGTPLVATTQLHVQQDSTVRVITRATSAWPEAVQELVPDMDWRATPLPETGAPGPEQAEADACMLYSSSPGIDSHQITSPSPGEDQSPSQEQMLSPAAAMQDEGVQTRNAAARRQAQQQLQEQLQAQLQSRKLPVQLDAVHRSLRDESLAPSDASEQMHVEYTEGAPLIVHSVRVTRSHGAQH